MGEKPANLDALLLAHQQQLETASPLPAGIAERYIPLSLERDGAARKVYRVRERLSDEQYILKIAAGANGALLWREYALLKTLKYPCFPRPVQCFELGGAVCLVREYIPGHSLEAHAQAHAMTPREVCALLPQVCDIAAILHAQSPPYIHRDLTPRNLIIAPDGRLVLIDLDSARPYGTDKAGDTVALGTLGAAAPEQYGARQSDARTDVFGIGMLAAYLLLGEYAPEKLTRAHGGALAKAIQKATAFDPAARYPSVAALKRDLRRAARPGITRTKWIGAGALALAAAVFLWLWLPGALSLPFARAAFQSPPVAKAAAHSLGVDEGAVTNALLSSVTEILLLQNDVFDEWDDTRTFGITNIHFQGHQCSFTPGSGTVSSLEDIARMPNLRYLALVNHNASDLTPLADLRLSRLSLMNSPVRDLSPLSGMTTLQRLDINGTQVENLEALRGLVALTELSIVDTAVRGLWPLEELPALTDLYMGGENCYYDVASLGRLTRLNHLWITRPGPELLPEINRLTALTSLFFCPYPGEDLTPLSQLTGLQHFGVMGPALRSLAGIEAFQSLHSFNFAVEHAMDFSPLEALPELRELYLHQAHLADLTFVGRLAQLDWVIVREEQVAMLPELPEGVGVRVQE